MARGGTSWRVMRATFRAFAARNGEKRRGHERARRDSNSRPSVPWWPLRTLVRFGTQPNLRPLSGLGVPHICLSGTAFGTRCRAASHRKGTATNRHALSTSARSIEIAPALPGALRHRHFSLPLLPATSHLLHLFTADFPFPPDSFLPSTTPAWFDTEGLMRARILVLSRAVDGGISALG
jgi:hypothetical protein